MRKITLLVGVALVATSLNAQVHRNTGCGLGSMIIENQDTVVKQVIAVTTNGTSGSQTFGITSGSMNCDQPTKTVSNEKIEKFVADNMDEIAQDIASGNGENLDTLSSLLNIENKTNFNKILKDNFSKIYTSNSITSAQVIDNIILVIG